MIVGLFDDCPLIPFSFSFLNWGSFIDDMILHAQLHSISNLMCLSFQVHFHNSSLLFLLGVGVNNLNYRLTSSVSLCEVFAVRS